MGLGFVGLALGVVDVVEVVVVQGSVALVLPEGTHIVVVAQHHHVMRRTLHPKRARITLIVKSLNPILLRLQLVDHWAHLIRCIIFKISDSSHLSVLFFNW